MKMTREYIAKLSDDELRLRVAELDGWKWHHETVWKNNSRFSRYGRGSFNGKLEDQLLRWIPSYCSDLNAINDAEKTLKTFGTCEDEDGSIYNSPFSRYIVELWRITTDHKERKTFHWPDIGSASALIKIVHATARQRAEAFLMAMQ